MFDVMIWRSGWLINFSILNLLKKCVILNKNTVISYDIFFYLIPGNLHLFKLSPLYLRIGG